MYVEALKDKSAPTVKKAFQKIFSSFTSPITKIETDEGGEFTGLKPIFKKEKIIFNIAFKITFILLCSKNVKASA